MCIDTQGQYFENGCELHIQYKKPARLLCSDDAITFNVSGRLSRYTHYFWELILSLLFVLFSSFYYI